MKRNGPLANSDAAGAECFPESFFACLRVENYRNETCTDVLSRLLLAVTVLGGFSIENEPAGRQMERQRRVRTPRKKRPPMNDSVLSSSPTQQ